MTEAQLKQLYDDAETRLRSLSDALMKGKKPRVGPHAFFYFSGLSLERLENCLAIARRLFAARHRLNELAQQERVLIPNRWPAGKPYPQEVRPIHAEQHTITLYMRMDMESLYLFGRFLLDQWSLQAFVVGGVPTKDRQPLTDLVKMFDNPNRTATVLDPLWTNRRGDLLWLHYQLRFYRNKIVVHPDRPWQRGSSHTVLGNDFRLDMLTPPNWLDDVALDRETKQLMTDAPTQLQAQLENEFARGGYRCPLEFLFQRIEQFQERDYRERIVSLFIKAGGSTPTFQTFAQKLFCLVANGTADLEEIASQNLENIDLGAPFKPGWPWEDRPSKFGLRDVYPEFNSLPRAIEIPEPER